MYELILTVLVTFTQPVLILDGHGVSMVTHRYEVAVQSFKTMEECTNFAGYADLEKLAGRTPSAQTPRSSSTETAPQCRKQPASGT